MKDSIFTGNGRTESMMRVSQMQADTVIELAACLAVSRTLLVAMIRCLPVASLAEVDSAFRENIEDVLAKADDKVMPEEFDRAFFNELNNYLRVMEER